MREHRSADSSKVGVGTRQRFHFAFHSSHSRVHSNIDNKKWGKGKMSRMELVSFDPKNSPFQ